jgi:hypothetical protein
MLTDLALYVSLRKVILKILKKESINLRLKNSGTKSTKCAWAFFPPLLTLFILMYMKSLKHLMLALKTLKIRNKLKIAAFHWIISLCLIMLNNYSWEILKNWRLSQKSLSYVQISRVTTSSVSLRPHLLEVILLHLLPIILLSRPINSSSHWVSS